ncbi:hypothetical protein NHX12_021878 [Muraenolepis orangiensis]|uniref:Uncharacterized protein n=1 Tax=Muraenolepis orangiensis TaxID=630683 RepID=A0A9Q0ER19_9TELE|nr:hypothetical protein NHX12_021878 [Muraenolepis orangiensis]
MSRKAGAWAWVGGHEETTRGGGDEEENRRIGVRLTMSPPYIAAHYLQPRSALAASHGWKSMRYVTNSVNANKFLPCTNSKPAGLQLPTTPDLIAKRIGCNILSFAWVQTTVGAS